MLLPPIPTPFDDAGEPDWGALNALIDAVAPHTDGQLVFGSNGENVHLTADERAKGLREVARRKRGERKTLVGIIEETTDAALKSLASARECEVHAALVTPPRYYAPAMDSVGLERYVEQVSAAEVPLWLYHVPQCTHVEMPVEVVSSLARNEKIVGIKDSSGQLGRIAYYAANAPDLFVCTGHAPTAAGAIALGAQGAILAAANVAPRAYRQLIDLALEGNAKDARDLANELEPLGRLLAGGGFVLLKQTLRYLGFPAGVPRQPYPDRSPLWPRIQPVIDEMLADGLVERVA